MQATAALLVMALEAGGARAALPELRQVALAAAAEQGPAPLATAAPGPQDAAASAPPCLGEVCQPQVSVPGYAPRYSLRGARTRLTLEALDALRLEPVASVAWWIASTGVRLDYTPAALDSALHGGLGVSRLLVTVGWRLDAWGAPVLLERRRRAPPL